MKNIRRLSVLILAALFLAAPAWGLTGYRTYIVGSADHTKVSNDLSNFTALVKITSSEIDLWKLDDLGLTGRVTATDGTTDRYMEFVGYDGTTALYEALLPTLSSVSDSQFRYYYRTEYDGVTTTTSAWESGWKLVCHMDDWGDTSTVHDSTSNKNNGTKRGAAAPAVSTAGQVGSCQAFDGTDSITFTPINPNTTPMMISFLLKCPDTIKGTSNDNTVFSLRNSAVRGSPYVRFGQNWSAEGYPLFGVRDDAANDNAAYLSTNLADGAWHHVALYIVPGDNAWYAYIDGSLDTTKNDGTITSINNANSFVWGDEYYNSAWRGYDLTGSVDEIKVYVGAIANIADYVAALKNDAFGTLVTYGSEQTDDTLVDDYDAYADITITGQAGSGTNYAVPITIHSGSGTNSAGVLYCRNLCDDFPNDIVFTGDNGESILKHTVADTSVDPVTAWVRVGDNLDANADIRAYFGKSSMAHTGIRPIATGGYGYNSGTVYVATKPNAVYYDGATYDRTFIVFQDTDGNPNITYIDHSTGAVATPVKIADSPISPDFHSGGFLCIVNGYLCVFYGGHGSDIYWTRSVNLADSATPIAAWETPQVAVSGTYSYPFGVVKDTDDVWLFWRDSDIVGNDSGLSYAVCADADNATFASATFGAKTILAAYGNANPVWGVYGLGQAILNGDDILVPWCWWDVVNARRDDGAFAVWDESDGQWEKADGTAYTLPVDSADFDKVYEAGTDNTDVFDVGVDEYGNYYVGYSFTANPYPRVARYSSGWTSYTVPQATEMDGEGMALNIVSATNWQVFGGAYLGYNPGEFQIWETDDTGATWYKSFSQECPKTIGSVSIPLNATSYVQAVIGYGYYPPGELALYGTCADNYYDGDAVLFMENGEIDRHHEWAPSDTDWVRKTPLCAGTWLQDATTKRTGSYSMQFHQVSGDAADFYVAAEFTSEDVGIWDVWINPAQANLSFNVCLDEGATEIIDLQFDGSGNINYYSGAGYTDTTYDYTSGSWKRLTITWNASTDVVAVVYDGDTIVANAKYNDITSGIDQARIQGDKTDGDEAIVYVDDMIVRPYNATEPTVGTPAITGGLAYPIFPAGGINTTIFGGGVIQ